MEQLNRIELRGTVGEITVRQVGEAHVANFSVCTNYKYTSKDGVPVIETTWHKVSVWANTPKGTAYIQRIKTGDPVAVIGRLKVKRFVRSDGQQATIHEIAAQRVEILGGELMPETDPRKEDRP